jgi:hypothetical protein
MGAHDLPDVRPSIAKYEPRLLPWLRFLIVGRSRVFSFTHHRARQSSPAARDGKRDLASQTHSMGLDLRSDKVVRMGEMDKLARHSSSTDRIPFVVSVPSRYD